MSVSKSKGFLLGVAGTALVLGSAGAARAQDAEQREPVASEDIVVLGQIQYRNRVEGAPPVLEYGTDFFQRFEPLTVGDMLKRVPSAAFTGADAGEFDRLSLRGLGGSYTQVLINGERVPGSETDRSFWVDRVPAELIERVEIIRSGSANRSGDATAGALNIVTRDAFSLDGGYLRGGALYLENDGEIEPLIGGAWSGAIGGGARGIFGFDVQGRHNAKDKVSFQYESPADGDPIEFVTREDETDVRDGMDYSFNADLIFPVGAGELEVSSFYVLTDREETEYSPLYEDMTSTAPADRVELAEQLEDIQQQNLSLGVEYRTPMLGGESEIEVGYARFEDDITAFETTTNFGDAEYETEITQTDMADEEFTFELSHERELGEFAELELGVDYLMKNRDTIVNNGSEDADIGDPLDPIELELDGDFTLEEQRIDPYVMLSGGGGIFNWEAGVRYEHTEVEIRGFADYDDDDLDDFDTVSTEYSFVLPSAHLRVNLTENDRLNFSVARTVHRPNFNDLSPVAEDEEPTDDFSLIGNPELEPESAWGADVGYEHRLGRAGVVGVNVFYRDITDLIELADTGDEFEGLPLLSPLNVGDGEVYGVEFDLSTPLTFLGLENTGVFINYAWLDSEVTDPVTGQSRRFNDQAESVYNVGFIHDMPAINSTFGVSYRKQGDSFARIAGEEGLTTYEGDLELFIEHRFGERFTLRFTGQNLLDAEKAEDYRTWPTVESQLTPGIEEGEGIEYERETAGPRFQLVGRVAF